jgi:FAD/FMN-containing dehydrogenase
MNRRMLLGLSWSLPLLARSIAVRSADRVSSGTGLKPRVRPGDRGWPSPSEWRKLDGRVGGRLLTPASPLAGCSPSAPSAACADTLRHLKNPYYLGDQVALTQTSGWANAWRSQPSAYAVAAANTADVVAAVNFAREHRLRLVVKGGGHSYQGTSQAPDSLLLWTRPMNAVVLHDAFIAQGCGGKRAPQPAVSIEAGAMWIDAYAAVTTRAGRYVQGGGCTTVGVAGLIQSGGFGSFSKAFGTAAGGLLEAEVVTADGVTRIVNECLHPDLFFALRGGGGGSFGVVTRVVLRTQELPETFGGVFGTISASSDEAYRALIARVIELYRTQLFNPHWGEQLKFRSGNILEIAMVFQGLDQAQATAVWAPFFAAVRADPRLTLRREPLILALPARHFWDAALLKQHAPSVIVADDRQAAGPDRYFWAGDQGQVGWFIHGFRSAFLSQSLLAQDRQSELVDALYAASRHWEVSLHFNKGLAGAPPEALAAAQDTATNPQVLDAFALAICGAGGPAAFEGLPAPDLSGAAQEAAAVDRAMEELAKVAPAAGSYVSESNYFDAAWKESFWGGQYARLAAVKQRYDPEGLFYVRHGVGSEAWSEDGFTPLAL